MKIETKINIKSNLDTVWKKLVNFENYPNWNLFITKIEGEKKTGATLSVEISPPGGQKTIFKPIILKYEEKKELRWVGILLSKHLFSGEHYFQLSLGENGTTTLIHGENFTGLLAPLIMLLIAKKTEAGFNLMNENLKNALEPK